MIGAIGLSIAGLAISLLATTPLVLGIGILFIGLSAAIFGLARHAFLTSFVPLAYRARALSTLGGTFRLGYFVGPFITATVIHATGVAASAFWIHLAACLGAAIILLALPEPSKSFGALARGDDEERVGLFRTIYDSRRVLSRLGLGATLIGAMRASRQVVLPLWAVSIGVSDTNTAIIIGIAGAVDFALFYTGGHIMDRYGRLWTALPSMIGLGLGHLVLAFTHDAASNVGWFIFAAMFLSLANGIGSGILMTLGSDLADARNPAPFLGAWRFTATLGAATAPLLLAGITAVATLALATGVIGALGLVGAGILARYMPQFVPKVTHPES
jgi:MFS family permease